MQQGLTGGAGGEPLCACLNIGVEQQSVTGNVQVIYVLGMHSFLIQILCVSGNNL